MTLRLSDITNALSGEKLRKAALVIGAALILLIFLSTLGGTEEEQAPPTETTAQTEQQLEKRLSELLTQIEGAGEITVMLTLDSTAESVYARDTRQSESAGQTDSEASVVLAGGGSAKSAIEERRILPQVRGAAVICSGARDPAVKERVTNTTARVLGIGTSRIYVTY